MIDTDLVSVIIPTYNRANLIKRSVESVLNQTYKNLELIIVDDGSTDNTKEVINSIKDERIVYIYQQNQKVCAARNTGVAISKGKYISFQDSDDICHPNKIEKLLQKLKENNADFTFGKMFLIGNLIKRVTPKNFKEGFLGEKDLPLGVNSGTLFGKREVFINNKFDVTLPSLEDFEVAIRIKKSYSIYCVDEPLVDYYIQENSMSNDIEKKIKALEIILEKNKNFLNDYSSDSLEFLAKIFLDETFKIKDAQAKQKALDLICSISNSKNIKIKYLLHKLYFYKLKTLMYKTTSRTIKKIIMFSKNLF